MLKLTAKTQIAVIAQWKTITDEYLSRHYAGLKAAPVVSPQVHARELAEVEYALMDRAVKANELVARMGLHA